MKTINAATPRNRWSCIHLDHATYSGMDTDYIKRQARRTSRRALKAEIRQDICKGVAAECQPKGMPSQAEALLQEVQSHLDAITGSLNLRSPDPVKLVQVTVIRKRANTRRLVVQQLAVPRY